MDHEYSIAFQNRKIYVLGYKATGKLSFLFFETRLLSPPKRNMGNVISLIKKPLSFGRSLCMENWGIVFDSTFTVIKNDNNGQSRKIACDGKDASRVG